MFSERLGVCGEKVENLSYRECEMDGMSVLPVPGGRHAF